MCRYAQYTYKPHYVCFECRKTFKRRLLSDIEGKNDFELNPAKCPECESLMASMGKDFEAPKRNNIKKWEHIKTLYKVDITFHSCGCSGPGYIPNTKEKLVVYFEELIQEYHFNLDFWRNRKEPTNNRDIDRDNSKSWAFISKVPFELRTQKDTTSNEEAKLYWFDKIKQVEQKLASINSNSK